MPFKLLGLLVAVGFALHTTEDEVEGVDAAVNNILTMKIINRTQRMLRNKRDLFFRKRSHIKCIRNSTTNTQIFQQQNLILFFNHLMQPNTQRMIQTPQHFHFIPSFSLISQWPIYSLKRLYNLTSLVRPPLSILSFSHL